MFQIILHRRINSAAFIVSILSFILPFISVSCQNTRIIKFSGFELIKGISNSELEKRINAHPFWGPTFKEWKKSNSHPLEVQPVIYVDNINTGVVFLSNPEQKEEQNNTILEEGIPINLILLICLILGFIGFITTILPNYKLGASFSIACSLITLILLWLFIYYAEDLTSESTKLGSIGILKIKKEIGFWLMNITCLCTFINSFYLLIINNTSEISSIS